MTATPRLTLPFLSAGQAQKEFTHNEALQILDSVVAAAAEDGPLDTPPASPTIGDCYIVGSAPTDDWAANAECLASYTSGGWRFTAAIDGMSVFVRSVGVWANFRSGAWEMGLLRGSSVVIGGNQVVGARAAAIASTTGGTTIDAEARSTLDEILGALRQHGLIET
jgi:hypothetical protein